MKNENWLEYASLQDKMFHYFRICSHHHKKLIDKNMGKAEIYASQHRILALLERKPFSSQKEIADRMEVSTATIAVTLKKMEKSGYIKRIVDEEDNRNNIISVTEKGRQTLQDGFSIMYQIDTDILAAFTEEEIKEFTNLLERMHGKIMELFEKDYTK